MTTMLTPKQQRFVDGIIAGKCATQAARDAGCAASSAHVTGSRWLRLAKIQTALDKYRRVAQTQAIASLRERQEWWTRVMLDESLPLLLRLRASELLGKSAGDFVQRHEHTGSGGGPIQTQVVRIISPPGSAPVNGDGFLERSTNGHSH